MKVKGRIFLLDDDELITSMLARALRKDGYEVEVETGTQDVISKIAAWSPDLVLLDIHLDEDRNGLEVLGELKREGVAGQVVMLTADDSAESAITAMKLGAADYLTKPFNMDEVKIVIRNILEKERLKQEVDYLRKARSSLLQEQMLGESPAIFQLRAKGEKLAEAHVKNVLITGESGTGKEVLARHIHQRMHHSRSEDYAPFIAVNCTALPDHLFESELFGHVKGAFTDAKAEKKGMFELANGGTILLDEIGDMQPNLQSKLLRVIEDRQVRRLGGKLDMPIDVTVIATTNRDLSQAVAEGGFRMDLYYRLNTFALHIPPLREHKEDIPMLAAYFLKFFSQMYLKTLFKGFSPEAEASLIAHDWPGNIRELKNAIERIVVLENVEIIGPEHLPIARPGSTRNGKSFGERSEAGRFILPETGISLEAVERDLIEQALRLANNNQSQAARLLDITRDSLRYQIKKFGLASD